MLEYKEELLEISEDQKEILNESIDSLNKQNNNAGLKT